PMSRTCTTPRATAAPAPARSRCARRSEQSWMSEVSLHTQLSCPGLSRASTRSRVPGRILSIAALAFILATCAFVGWVYSLGPLPLDEAHAVSTTIVDRNGKLLRAYAMADGRWRLPVDARANVDPTYLKLLFAYEDQRFYVHDGVDPLALGRAAVQL